MNGSYTFTTTASNILPQSTSDPAVILGNVENGNYKPSDSSNPDLSHSWSGLIFPMNVNGNWTIEISDNEVGNVGDLISWSLSFATVYSHSITGPGTIGSVKRLVLSPVSRLARFHHMRHGSGSETQWVFGDEAAS